MDEFLKNALTQAGAAVEKLIRDDEFPACIEPAYLRRAVLDYPLRGGKRIRPALLLWCCELVGGEPERALNAAAAAEIYHNWTLVHDDIIDNDEVRRGKPSCHAALRRELAAQFGLDDAAADKAGRDFAVLAGDLQQGWAIDMLLRSTARGVSPEVVAAICRNMQRSANRELISGEAVDVEFSLRPPENVGFDEVMKMISLKTGALLRFAAESGAMIGLECPDTENKFVRAAGEFAAAAGIVFQLRDDYLGLFGDYAKFGKPIGSDLREGKATLLLAFALKNSSGENRRKLLSLIGGENLSAESLAEARTLVSGSGAVAEQEKLMERSAAAARRHLDVFAECAARKNLLGLLDYFICRVS